jgi:hypothetical protein
MAKPKAKPVMEGKYGAAVEAWLSTIVGQEYETAKSNNDMEYAEFENLIDLLDGIRPEKNFSWQSDIHIPLFSSHLLSDASAWMQYFASRDFCNVYLEGLDPEDRLKSAATKTCINKTLNMPGINHFQKYVRGRMLSWLFGQQYALCYWEFKSKKVMEKQPPIIKVVPEYNQLSDQVVMRQIEIPQPDKEIEHVIYDRFNYESIDPRNVYTDYSYSYSIQEKSWVIIRTETTLSKLEADAERCGYFNLDVVKEALITNTETETGKETYNADGFKSPFGLTPETPFDLLQRFGKMWTIVEERDAQDTPIKGKPGYSETGDVLETAEMIETITTYAMIKGRKILIRFQPTPNIDSKGEPFKPIVRGWCYIHPTKDTGLSDGKNIREINVAIDDTFNVSQMRVMLATLPVFKGRKAAMEDNPTVYIEPEHIIELEDPDRDLKELVVRDNIMGALQQISMLDGWASKVDAVYSPQMGGMPAKTSVTAMASATGEAHANARQGFKSLTHEYTFLCDFYWQILQMTHRFARTDTAVKLMGKDLAYHFDPNGDYTYIPLSQSLEAEHTKAQKISNYDQMTGRLSGLAKIVPQGIIPIIAWIIGQQAMELGSEFQSIQPLLENLIKSPVNPEGKAGETTADQPPQAMSNQNGIPQSGMEQNMRAQSNLMAGNA